jgi:hypothetical protein
VVTSFNIYEIYIVRSVFMFHIVLTIKQRLFPWTAISGRSLQRRWSVFTVWYELYFYILLRRNAVFKKSRVEAGSNTFIVTLRVEKVTKREPSAWGFNQTTLFLGDINMRTWPPNWENLESETAKCGHEPRGPRIWEWLRWRGPAAIVNDRSILSSERMLHKDYNRKCSVGK